MASNANPIQREFDSKNISTKIRGSARVKAIESRSRLKTNNYEALEEHDQFYRDHKVLLHLFVVLGVVPVQRKTGRITYSWKTFPFFYALGLYCFTTTLVLLVGRERIDVLLYKSKKFDEYIYSIIFIVYLIPHFFIPYVGWAMGEHVCEYKNSWGRYQVIKIINHTDNI